jgi:hypothetical protein
MSAVPDIHVPTLEGHGGGKSIIKILLEVALISVGVFLGLAGESCRESAHHRELAEQTLRRFRSERTANRKAVADGKGYRADRLKELTATFRLPPSERNGDLIHMSGIRPSHFDRTAWDLALVTQALSYIDAELASSISKVYDVQERMEGLSRGLTQAMYINPPETKTGPFFGALQVYYGDAVVYDNLLLTLYDDVLPKIDKALVR